MVGYENERVTDSIEMELGRSFTQQSDQLPLSLIFLQFD